MASMMSVDRAWYRSTYRVSSDETEQIWIWQLAILNMIAENMISKIVAPNVTIFVGAKEEVG